MRTISELATVLPLTRYDCENWLKTLEFRRTHFQPASQGKARLYTKEHAFVLGLLGAMVKGGALPSQAVLLAERVAQNWRMGRQNRWLVFADGQFNSTSFSTNADAAYHAKALKAITVSMIDLAKIQHRIDDLFEVEA